MAPGPTHDESSRAKGKTLEEVDFSTDIENHSISLVFRNKTARRFDIAPDFRLQEPRRCCAWVNSTFDSEQRRENLGNVRLSPDS